ncbi:penicillin-binding protein [Clostridium sp. USBA 49]|uniref:penicillin-binding transpeptidase domain-containing protein n=1 Tax=Clostridium sp. USBA 49 TaxID=1881060 RepID=UPI0009C4493A|nr:penicillin-binding transpeptidase domain-containing protein [Clostridium sp. USBA 49]SKA77946.1 penicillin-binding protein [Clostridium sp. USBA 49]
MKNKKHLLGLLLIIVFSLTGCFKSKSPNVVFDEFSKFLAQKDYSSMYNMLSSESKKNIDEKYFTERYKNIYDAAHVSKIIISPSYPEKFEKDKDNKVKFPVKISLQTPIGNKDFTYEVSLINEKQGKSKDWYVVWDESMILPNLTKGDSISYVKSIGKRGEIKDRNGKGLAVNRKAVDIYIVPEKIQSDKENIINQLSSILKVTKEEIENVLNQPYVKSHPDQRAFVMRLSREDDIDKAKKAIELPGVFTSTASEDITIRYYPEKEAAAQLIGYVDNITAEELKKYKDQGYDSSDIIGKTGLESIYEKRLRGEAGGAIYINDDKGVQKEVVLEKEKKDGEDITISIDINLQKNIYNEIKGDSGTGVAVNPKTGEVLALVSTPSYDPNLIVSEISNRNYIALEKNESKPLLSKFSNATVPGSTFKPITAAIGLKTNKLDPSKKITIQGEKWQKDSSWGNYFVTRVHSEYTSLNLMEALIYSDNIYFAKTALDIGKDNFINGAKDFGIGEKIEFPFPMVSSQIGDINDKDGIKLADSGYGQGDVLMNPLQLALIYGSFVNNGNILKPILDMKDKTDNPKIWKENVISKEIADIINKDLIQVIENPNGTGHDAKISGITLAGKTGTAELKQNQGKTGKENGWFISYNTENPSIMTVMMIENVENKGGSSYVVPKVKNVMEKYLKH